jgi:hypothetical protein
MSDSNFKKLAATGKINKVRSGGGVGSYALVEVATLPQRFQERIVAKYGDMKEDILRNWFGSHFRLDAKARAYYMAYRLENGEALSPEHIEEYVANASTIEAVLAVLADVTLMRKAMKGDQVNWCELAGAISFYQTEFGHTLPLSVNRFKKRVNDFKKLGYESLISKRFMNQNRRKVSCDIERLVLAIDAQPERPYNTTVAEQYNLFVRGELTIYDPETGEVYAPEAYRDRKGNPMVLSESTIVNILNNPKNRALRAKFHSDEWTFNNEYRPYHLRHLPTYAFSKISADDRDLPRKLSDGKYVHAYYVSDVLSGAIVGYSYNRKKDTALFVGCMRNLFQTIERNGWGIPAQIEVEHHLVRDFADELMKEGVIFPMIRWCNPGNSREKRQEHVNRAKKYGVEKRHQAEIGRWWSSLEANRPKIHKVYDEDNHTYVTKTYGYEELVADDIAMIRAYNNQLHPNQKLYPGRTRWDVLCQNQNPELGKLDKAVVSRVIGEHTETTIRQNMYFTVQYGQYMLSSPEVIEKLEPRNYKVDAYYLPNEAGEIEEVYIYQKGRLLDTCRKVPRYNEATAEQTAEDRANYEAQARYVAKFDRMMREGKVKKVGIMEPADVAAVMETRAEAVEAAEAVALPPEEEDYSEFMDEEYWRRKSHEQL